MKKQKLCTALKEALKEQNMTPRQLALRLGKSVKEVHAWLNDTAKPAISDLYTISVVVNKNVGHFLNEEHAPFIRFCNYKTESSTRSLEERIANLEQVVANLIENYFSKPDNK